MRSTQKRWQWAHRLLALASASMVITSMVTIDGAAFAAQGSGSGGGGTTTSLPTVTAVTPNTGSAAGGTVVAITGTNFNTAAGGTTVKFGANSASAVSCVSATQCSATSPAGQNRVDVTVTTAAGTSATNSKDRFNYVPVLTSITPANGPAAGGTPVKLVGQGLATGATTVTFGASAPITAACTADGLSCTLTTPPGVAGSTVNVVATSGGGASNAIPFTFDAAAAGAPGILTLNATQLNFTGTAVGGTSAPQTVSVTNNGSAPASIASITVAGDTTPADFARATSASADCGTALPSTLALGASCNIDVVFKPSAAGSVTGKLTVTDGAGKAQTVALGGTSTASSVNLSPTSLNFGSVQSTPAVTSAPQTVTLRNAGNAALNITNIAITGTDAAAFARTAPATGTNCATTFPATLAPGASCVMSVTYTPTATAPQTAALQVSDGSPHTVTLQGTGVVSATPVIDTITPNHGKASGGDTVIVAGQNLSNTAGATAIKLGDRALTNVKCTPASGTTPSQCSGTTANGLIGAQPVSATVNGQAASNPTNVSYTYDPVPNSGTVTAGPIDPATGLPTWFRDASGKHLELCVTGANCLAVLPNPGAPAAIPGNFPDEAFYWDAVSIMNVGAAGAKATLIMATEALGPTTAPVAPQTVISRMRLTILAGGLDNSTTYTLTTPYGVGTFTTLADGSFRNTVDITGPLTAGGELTSQIGPWLSQAANAPAGTIGDAAAAHPVTGSPIGQNVFRIDGPNAGGAGKTSIQTTDFTIQGKLATPKASPAGGVYQATQSVTLKPADPQGTIKYTTDPNGTPATAFVPGTPVSVGATTTLKFVETYSDGSQSPVVTETYTIDTAAAGKPSITKLEPNVGPAFGGTSVTVTGNNFSTVKGGTTFKFGTDVLPTENVNCTSATSCTVVTPGGAVGAVEVTATVASQVSLADPTGLTKFTYQEVSNNGSVSPGPIDSTNGYPSEYRDGRGLRLEMCLDQTSGMCLAVPPDTSKAISFPFNFPDEGFWWEADSSLTGVGPGGTGKGLIVLATEWAFFTPSVVPGQQISFNRTRIRISNLVAGEHYTITHPYGVEDLVAELQADGTGRINVTTDVGCVSPPCAFNTPLGPNTNGPSIGPWLRWDAGAPDGFIGDGATEHKVTGSPIGQNVFRVEGKDAGGVGVNVIENPLFIVQGKLAGPKVTADKVGGTYSSSVQVKLTATDANNETSQIWYTLDGSTPTVGTTNPSSKNYADVASTGGVPVGLGNTTLKFVGKNTSGGLSPVYTENYVVAPALPSASPAGGEYPAPVSVTLTPGVSGDLVKYTTDGTDPSLGGLNATAAIAIAQSTTLKFVEVFADGTVSPVVTQGYTIDGVKPSVVLDNPVPGYYHTAQQVNLRADKPADIWYNASTTGTPADPCPGGDPCDGKPLSGTKYDGKPIAVSADTTFALRARDAAGNTSELQVATWHVKLVTQLGPLDPATGYPTWYVDSNGLQLQLCVDATGNCLTSVADPSLPASVPSNFIDEGFYWNGTATMAAGNSGKATLTLATEAAFATGPVIQGQQIAFNRIRVKVTNLTPGATYTITHPYGVETVQADDGGTIFSTDDNGCLDAGTGCLASTVLGGRLGPWLTPVTPGPAGYIGDAATPSLVTGSPAGTNFFRIEGPNAGGNGVDIAETNLFVVAGKLSSTVTPLATPTVPSSPTGLTATAGDAQVALTWTASTTGASTTYTVKRATTTGGAYTDVATGLTTTSFTDKTVANGTQYFYVVTAVNTAGESTVSNEANATPQKPVAAPVVTFSPTSLSFGQTKGGQKVGQTSTPLLVTLTNSGNAPLNITNVNLGGASPNAFAISANNCVGTIAAGASCSISVTFTPTVKGNVTATLNVTDQLGTQTVNLLGKGN
jgi:hypothetical protein